MVVTLLGRCRFKSVRIPSPTRTCDFMKRFWLRRDSIHGPSEPSLGSTSSALTARPQADKNAAEKLQDFFFAENLKN